MKLRQKILLLAVAPLTIAMLAIMLTVRHQSIALAQHERQLVESAYLQAKEAELRAHVKLARSAIAPLLASGRSDQATRDEAMRTLARLDFGPDGYFFLYDLRGRNLMHPRQPELVGRDLWRLTDARGQPTIQRLVAAAQAGGGFVRYLWDKPSSHQSVAKLGYVEPIPQWGWMVGTGLYLDDVEQTLREIDRRAQANIDQTLAWVVAIAAVCILLVAGSGLALNVSDHREADAKLRQLAQQVVHSQEDERARVSRELHDGISQVLVSTKLLLETAHGHLEPPPGHATPPGAPATDKAAGMLRRALDRLNGALGEVRRVSHNLRPALLDDLGLAAALELLVRETREAHEDRQPGFAITLETAARRCSCRTRATRPSSASRRRRSPTSSATPRAPRASACCSRTISMRCACRSATTARASTWNRSRSTPSTASACATCASAWPPWAAPVPSSPARTAPKSAWRCRIS